MKVLIAEPMAEGNLFIGSWFKTTLPRYFVALLFLDDLLNGPTRASFLFFWFFSNTNFREKTVVYSWIRTQIVRVEGKHPDHLTTTTALLDELLNRTTVKSGINLL